MQVLTSQIDIARRGVSEPKIAYSFVYRARRFKTGKGVHRKVELIAIV